MQRGCAKSRWAFAVATLRPCRPAFWFGVRTPFDSAELRREQPDYSCMEGDNNAGDATSHELILHQLMSLQADIEAIKQAQVLLLKVLVNFPAGQTPQRWLQAV